MTRGAIVGQTLDGKYRLERMLGKGAMGAVYLATHLGTGRAVAVKVIAAAHEGQSGFVERFQREARAAGRLRHPGVVDVTDFGVATLDGDTFPYLVMEYLDGCTLAEVLREEDRLPVTWVVDILEQACSAVQEAHDQGILHRDLKPDNLWLEPNRRGGFTVKVLDFGLAKLAEPVRGTGATVAEPPASAVDPEAASTVAGGGASGGRSAPAPRGGVVDVDGETIVRPSTPTPPPTTGAASSPRGTGPGDADITRVGDVLGTPLYMSPEQCRGLPLDARSDVYSLGVVTYHLLAGAPPFAGDARRVMRQHVEDPPPPLESRRKEVPRAMAELVAEALAKEPAARPKGPAAFATALRARSEGIGPLFQRLVTLLGERYPFFLRLSLLGHLPLVGGSAVLVALGLLIAGDVPASMPTRLGARGLLVIAVTLSALATSALCEAALMRALVEPLRPLAVRPLLDGLHRRSRAYTVTFGPFVALGPYLALAVLVTDRLHLGRTALLVLAAPVIAALLWSLLQLRAVLFLSSVIHVEGLAGRKALVRSSQLARRAVRDLPAVSQGALLTSLLAAPVWIALGWGMGRLARTDALWGVPLGQVTITGLIGLLATPALVVSLPLFAVASSLLYFRAREATGEPLAEILGQFEGGDGAPAWRTRVRERVREHLDSGV